jgi:hypothetical protein
MSAFPGRLEHRVPVWVKDGAAYHIRWRAAETAPASLVEPALALPRLAAAGGYHHAGRWFCDLILIMPDHIHAIVGFPRDPGMSETLRHWKRGTSRPHGIEWQDGYFDHRLRSQTEAQKTWHYIRRNPVAKQLCASEDDWPWWWNPSLRNPLLPPEDSA